MCTLLTVLVRPVYGPAVADHARELHAPVRAIRPVTENAARAISEYVAPLAEGARIPSERELAAALGLSRPAVREALVKLEMSGEVYAVPQRGRYRSGRPGLSAGGGAGSVDAWLVAQKTRLRDLDEVREVLEARAVQHLTSSQARQAAGEARQILAEARDLVARGRYEQLGALDSRFHKVLCGFTSNRTLRDLIHELIDATEDLATSAYALPGVAEHSLGQHADIVEALADGEVHAAALLVAAHAYSGGRYTVRVAEQASRASGGSPTGTDQP